MYRELSANEVVYSINFDNVESNSKKHIVPEYGENVYRELDDAFYIDNRGFNVYLVDDVSLLKIDKLKKYLENLMYNKKVPGDICYVIKDSIDMPMSLVLKKGNGIVLKNELEMLQKKYYDVIFDFYNSDNCKEKENIIDSLQTYRTKLIEGLVDKAHNSGFDIKSSYKGFAFIPLNKDDGVVTEEDFEFLKSDEKTKMLETVEELKSEAMKILNELKDKEIEELEKLKEYFTLYIEKETVDLKADIRVKFDDDENAFEYLQYVYCNIEKDIINNYTMSFDDDENIIKEILLKYNINVFYDASKLNSPRVIFENDPSISNLFGNIEYVSKNGTYQTEISMIMPGSIVKANGGCLILDINKLLNYPKAYDYLKKFIEEGKIKLDYNKNYLDLLTINSIKPEPCEIHEKIILVGNAEIYNILYAYDNDFKKLFKTKVEYNPVVEANKINKSMLVDSIVTLCKESNYKSLDKKCYSKIAKYLSREADDKNKMYFNIEKINDLLILSNRKSTKLNKDLVDLESLIFPNTENDLIEKRLKELYKNKHILINVKEKCIGQINGLSVIDLNYYAIGKPIRITCNCYKGSGNIVDIQKESDLSGKIHSKAVSTLNGLINNKLGIYTKIPVDFHLSFEQIYGEIDGDSASVAEYICMLSSLSKVPIKQNIAVTGSLNQFGTVQSIGGVNDKIEGFFGVCKLIDTVKDKGVLIPNTNKENLVLADEVEEAVKRNDFHIYVMENIEDAVEILMGNYEEIMAKVKKELKKYVK